MREGNLTFVFFFQLDDVRSGVNRLSDEADYSSSEADEPSKPDEEPSHEGFIFGYRSESLDLSSFHPSPAHILRLWHIYQVNVEPVLKILHVPTIDKLFRDLSSGSPVSRKEEPLVFTIYYAAVVSLEEDEVGPFSSPVTPHAFLRNRLTFTPPPSAKPSSPPPRAPFSPATASPWSRAWPRPTS